MRKTAILLAVALFSSAMAGGTVFRNVPREAGTFRTRSNVISDSRVEYRGSEDVLEMLRERGVPESLMMRHARTTVVTARVGSKDAQGRIAFQARIDSAVSVRFRDGILQPDAGKAEADTGIVASGGYGDSGLVIDEVHGAQLDSSLAAAVRVTMTQALSSIRFPRRPLNPGDTFSIRTPMTIPVQDGAPLDCEVATSYLLKEVRSGRARFSISQTYVIQGRDSANPSPVSLRGGGSGELSYDLGLGMISFLEMNSAMHTEVAVGALTVAVETAVNTRSETSKVPETGR